MNHKFLFLMDPYPTLNLHTETSLLLMEELILRGHQVYWLEVEGLYLKQNQPRGVMRRVDSVQPFVQGEYQDVSLNDFDALLVRLDPPFDSAYLHTTYILDFLNPAVLQFNEVNALRNFNEKLLPLHWPNLTPPTITAMGREQIKTFLAEHKEIVLKPLDDCSGRGVVKLTYDEVVLDESQLTRHLFGPDNRPRYLLVQKYLSAVSRGDKRVYLVNGEAVGQVNRVPGEREFLANIHQGAQCESADLSAQEKQSLEIIAPFLIENGIFLAGIDFIDGYITEINLTSPSAIRQINEVMGEAVHHRIVNKILDEIVFRNRSVKAVCCGNKASIQKVA